MPWYHHVYQIWQLASITFVQMDPCTLLTLALLNSVDEDNDKSKYIINNTVCALVWPRRI